MSQPAPPSATPRPEPLAPAAPQTAQPAGLHWPDPAREQACLAWLQGLQGRHGLQLGTLTLASADASFRRYLRLQGDGGSFIVMDAPPDKEDCAPFVKVAGLLQAAGLQVPAILDWQADHGFMLLSDLGRDTMMGLIQQHTPALPLEGPGTEFLPRAAPGPEIENLYRSAIDDLVRWQLASRPGLLPAYDQAVLQRELALFPDWYLARHRGIDLAAPERQAMRATLDQVFARIVAHNLAAPSVFVHRDFMPRNLMRPLPGQQQLGVLDFQDALYGPVTYDIASLMRDAFWTWEEGFVLDITVRYWQQARRVGLLDHEGWSENFGDFYRAVEWMGLQRHLKIAGIFARLTLRDGKPRYLADTPRFIDYLRATAARYRELAPLLRLIDQVENIQAQVGYAYGRVQ